MRTKIFGLMLYFASVSDGSIDYNTVYWPSNLGLIGEAVKMHLGSAMNLYEKKYKPFQTNILNSVLLTTMSCWGG